MIVNIKNGEIKFQILNSIRVRVPLRTKRSRSQVYMYIYVIAFTDTRNKGKEVQVSERIDTIEVKNTEGLTNKPSGRTQNIIYDISGHQLHVPFSKDKIKIFCKFSYIFINSSLSKED